MNNQEKLSEKEIKYLLRELVIQIVRLKENECQNSGLNWLDKIKSRSKLIRLIVE